MVDLWDDIKIDGSENGEVVEAKGCMKLVCEAVDDESDASVGGRNTNPAVSLLAQ